MPVPKVLRFAGRLLLSLVLVFAAAVGILVLGVGGSAYLAMKQVARLGLGRDVAPGVTVAGIQRVRLGMSTAEVMRLLGAPYEVAVHMSQGHLLNCPGPLTAESAPVKAGTADLEPVLAGLRADTLRYCCPAYRHNRQDNIYFELVYSRPVPAAGEYPSVNVSLDECGQVYAVHVGHHRQPVAFWDDNYLPVYSFSRGIEGPDNRFVVPETLQRLLGR
jgi:hypothetical protein